LPAASVRHWRRVARWALPVLPLVALFGPAWRWLQGRVEGGLSLPAAVYAFWEPLVAWGAILGLLSLFQRRFAQPGVLWWRLWRALSRRAFAIFVIHPPVLVAVAVAWAGVPLPALLKFALTGSLTCGLCFGLAGLLLRVPGVARVL